jgi:hypothetical protein
MGTALTNKNEISDKIRRYSGGACFSLRELLLPHILSEDQDV